MRPCCCNQSNLLHEEVSWRKAVVRERIAIQTCRRGRLVYEKRIKGSIDRIRRVFTTSYMALPCSLNQRDGSQNILLLEKSSRAISYVASRLAGTLILHAPASGPANLMVLSILGQTTIKQGCQNTPISDEALSLTLGLYQVV